MSSRRTMVVPLGIRANFNDAERIANLVGRLPSVNSDFSKMKGPLAWVTTCIALPSNPKWVETPIVDRKAGLCFMPHSNFQEKLGLFIAKNPEERPIFVFDNVYGGGWISDGVLKGKSLAPGGLPGYEIGSWQAKSNPSMIAVSMKNGGGFEMTVILKSGAFAGEADCVAPLAVNTGFYPQIYAYASHPGEEREVAAEIGPENLAGGIGEKIAALKNVLGEELYFAINALAKAASQLLRAGD